VAGFAGQREDSAGDIVGKPHAGFFELAQERCDPLHKTMRLRFKEDLERAPCGETGCPSDASGQPVIQEDDSIIMLQRQSERGRLPRPEVQGQPFRWNGARVNYLKP